MIQHARLPERVVIGADTRMLVLQLNSTSGFETYQHKDPILKFKKNSESWEITPFAFEKGKMYFNLTDTTAMKYRGLYKGELWAENCLVDRIEVVKGASFNVKAETKDDECVPANWNEECPPEPVRCVTTQEYTCGCNPGGGTCPSCKEWVVIPKINIAPGY